jgi:NAD(P)-dependent dehydrogenase (short-subunit alcohol dehydrogenase family)
LTHYEARRRRPHHQHCVYRRAACSPHTAPYSASKHGLWGLTQVTALEGRPFGISCGCLYPGNTLVEKLRNRKEPMMTVQDLVQAVVAMATLPPHVNMLEAVVLPVGQMYLGRG